MTIKKVAFNCEESLHMKAIAMLIQKASAYKSRFILRKGIGALTQKVC